MQSAIYLMRQSGAIERRYRGKTFDQGNFVTHHRAYVVGAILAAAASIEGRINELYLDATDNLLTVFICKEKQKILSDLWPTLDERKFSTLDKYQILLTAIGKEKLNTSKKPFQDVKLLTDLRNMLVHYKPEWDDDQKDHKKIKDKLRGKFETNPFYSDGTTPFFPNNCLSYGCARWAVESSAEYILEFMSRIGAEQHQSFEIWKKLTAKIIKSKPF